MTSANPASVQKPNPSFGKSRRTFSYRRFSILAVGVRRRRAVRRLERNLLFFLRCGPVGHFVLWKPPRYFSASKFAGLATARRNQVGECVRVLAIVEAPRKFIHVEREILLAHLVIVAKDTALKERPESLDSVPLRAMAPITATLPELPVNPLRLLFCLFASLPPM